MPCNRFTSLERGVRRLLQRLANGRTTTTSDYRLEADASDAAVDQQC